MKRIRFKRNYHEVFWGANYSRLLDIKRKVDPHDVFFWCRACVWNEGWQEVGDLLCQGRGLFEPFVKVEDFW